MHRLRRLWYLRLSLIELFLTLLIIFLVAYNGFQVGRYWHHLR